MTVKQIKELIKNRPHRRDTDRGIAHQNRLRFHTETEIVKSELSPYFNEFLSWICVEKPELLPKDKVERFKQLLTCPLATVELTQSIAISLSRVFEGQDKFFRYDFKDDELLTDWEDYRDDEFWQTRGFEAMINAIDSVWVVDLPKIQEGDRPEPKNMLIDISDVIDISCTSEGDCNYVIFSINDRLYVYDNEYIRSFLYADKIIGEPPETEFLHELEYCPARMMWSEFLKKKNYINHKAPLTNMLSDLDWLLTHRTFKKYMDIANSYPILVMYEADNTSEDLKREDNKGRKEGQQQTLGHKLPGPGSVLTAPRPMEGQIDVMNNPLKWIAPELESLKFHVEEDDRLSDYIYKKCVGIDGEQKNDQAKNEKQVLASFENQSIILRRIARNFEIIHQFADETIIKLRYGAESINTVSIYYGTRFFLKTAEDLMNEKESAVGDDILTDAISGEIIETRFINDSAGRTRANVIRDLDPMPGKSLEDIIKIKNAGGLSEEAFKIKVNLMSLVARFEREQLPIAQFMKSGDYKERINLIKKEFIKYLSEEENDERNNSGQLEARPGDREKELASLSRVDNEAIIASE